MSAIVPFKFEDQEVRIIDQQGNPWFVLGDICRVLNIGNPSDAASRLDDDEKNTLGITEGAGNPEKLIVNESGLYSLILRSRKAEAKRFKKWVTAEVLPTIRKTGSFGVDPLKVLNDPAAMRGLLLTYVEKVMTLKTEVGTLKPKADALDQIATLRLGSQCITDVAKNLGTGRDKLRDWMLTHGWIYRREARGQLIATQVKIDAGLLVMKVEHYRPGDGAERLREWVHITPKGIAALALTFQTTRQQLHNQLEMGVGRA